MVTPFFSQVQLVTLVFWITHNQLRLILGYTLLLLSFIYSLFTLFHSRNTNFVLFLGIKYVYTI